MVECYKAKLVTKGFIQKEGIYYFETFSPIAKMVTVRTVLGLAIVKNWPIYHMDVYNVFLQGDLQEEVYMEIPRGFSNQWENGNNLVCRLFKSIYGLKQASR